MPRAAANLLFLTFASVGLCAAQSQVLVFSQPASSPASSCPIGIQAQPTPGLTQMVVHGTPPSRDDSNRAEYPAQQSLRILLTNPKALGITGIELRVHGLRPGGHVEPVVSPQQGAGALDKHVELQLVVDPGKRATRDVRFDGFTSIRSLDLESVTYSDGSVWHASAQQPCRFEPSRVMLVASGN
jgi:hypothetical protein